MSEGRGKLSLVPTPIGALADITVRALEVLRSADAVYAEDTRVTGRLLAAHGISVPLARLDEALMDAKTAEVVERVRAGERIAYCTDAGMPGVSDPGARLVEAARRASVAYEVLPGPSAAPLAYVLSGARSPRFYFGAFLPRKAQEQRALFASLRTLDAALVFYESPKRLLGTLSVIAEAFPGRQVTVCRELTKLHEEVVRGTATELEALFVQRSEEQGGIKGEIALVIDSPAAEEGEAAHAEALAAARRTAAELAREGLRTKELAVRLVAGCGVTRNDAYELAMGALKAVRETNEER